MARPICPQVVIGFVDVAAIGWVWLSVFDPIDCLHIAMRLRFRWIRMHLQAMLESYAQGADHITVGLLAATDCLQSPNTIGRLPGNVPKAHHTAAAELP